jgi:HK97 family phage prohead protease
METPDAELILEVKEVTPEGTFHGIASVYGVEDLGGDVIDPGAFTKTLAEKPDVPILWQHDAHEVIGYGSLKEWQGKVIIDAQLDMDDPVAVKAHRKMKTMMNGKRLIGGLSIGFQTVKAAFQEVVVDGAAKMVRRVQELKLWEVSIVTFPMLPQAQVTRVKSLADDARLKALEDKVSALSAAKVTPPPEPAKVEEPQRITPEPAKSHSGMISRVDALRALLQS